MEQYRSRFPTKLSREKLLELIGHEVGAALDEGRYSSKEPRWSRGRRARGKRNHHEIDRTLRFCWIEDESRLYLVDKRGTTVRVITVIKPTLGDSTDRDQLLD